MRSRTIQLHTLLLCLFLSTHLNGQISINYPENIRVECGADITPSPDNPIVGYPEITTTCANGINDVSFSDNIDQLTQCGGTGILLRFWSVSDNCGGFMTLLQRIVLVDNTPPEITCIPDVVVECDASLNPAENPDLAFPNVTDCSQGEDLTITYEDVNEGDGFCENLPEIVRRTWTVTDGCGNVSTCEQTIRVGKDPLLIFCEVDDIIHECNGLDGSRFAAESWDLSNTNQLRNCTQTDCGPVEIISDFDYGRISGDCGITGSFVVNYLIKDNCGNSKFKTVNFILRDTTPPESFCNPIDFGVDCGGDETAASRIADWHSENIALLETCLFDNCGDVTVTSNFIPSTFDINTLNFDCNDDVGFAVDYTLTDQCGNQTLKTAFLKVVDTTPPSFENVPQDTSIGANATLAIGQPTIIDNCSSGLTAEFTEERIDNDNDNGYQLIRTWMTTDDCGNTNTASQRVMVLDPILSLACTSAEVSLDGDQVVISNLLAPNEIVKVFASDNRIVYNCFRNCGEVQTSRPLAEDTYRIEIDFYTATWQLICKDERSITVGSGNSNGGSNGGGNSGGTNDPCAGSICEEEPPVLSNIPADRTVNFDAVPNPATLTATDNCDNDVQIAFLEERTDGDNTNNYVLTRSWIATDDCGNTATAEQVIRVVDEGNTGGNTDPCTANDCETIPPDLVGIPVDISVNFDAVPAPAQPTATDNCDSNVAISLVENIMESIDAKNYILVRTWTATDDCGNESTRLQTITVTGESGMTDTGDGNDGGGNNDAEGNGTGRCAEIVITTDALTFNFTNLNAPNKIVKVFDLDYNIILECQENCGTEISFSYETEGTYFADVQLYTANWDFICEVRETVELTDTPINIGGGSDSDDNSGGEPCTEVEVTVGSGSIGISNINAANKLIKLFDADYKVVEECVNNCGDPAILSRPANGDYLVDVQLYSADWQFICETQIPINVTNTTDGGNGNGVGGDNGNNGDGNTNGDNLCDNVNITYSTSAITLNNFKAPNKIVNVFDENYNQIYTCFTDCTTEVVAPISGIGTYLIDVQLYTDDWSLVCQQRTTLEVTADGGMNDNPNGGTTDIDECANAIIATTSTTISVENLTAPNTIVKVFNENFALIFECLGNCGAAATATDLIAGDYQVNINYFDENWQPICERVEQVALANNFDALSTDRSAKTAISSDNIQIYPNPATTELMVDLSAFGNEKVTVLVYNQLAAKVQEVQFTVANHEIKQMDLRGLQAGLYLLHVQVGARSPMAKKILVQ